MSDFEDFHRSTHAELQPSSALKRYLDNRLPWAYRPSRSAWQRYRSMRFRRSYGRLVNRVAANGGYVVRDGPFRGMKYVAESRSGPLLPRLLGTYELEIATHIVSMSRSHNLIIDIGCAEGYYAVGLAWLSPTCDVWAYEIDGRARTLCRELAKLNSVSAHVDVRDAFTPSDISSLPRDRNFLVLCDVEGYESQIFRPSTSSLWSRADLIVEVHDVRGASTGPVVRRCFEETHEITAMRSRKRTSIDFPVIDGFTEKEKLRCMDEHRGAQEWLIVRRRSVK